MVKTDGNIGRVWKEHRTRGGRGPRRASSYRAARSRLYATEERVERTRERKERWRKLQLNRTTSGENGP